MADKLKRPYPPMEARPLNEIPSGPEWQYEPKWDGFRCLAFKNGASVELQSKSGQSLTRYFPEIVSALHSLSAKRFVVDGELVIPEGRSLSFPALLLRLHPAESRVKKLAQETPALLIVFDLLADSTGKSLVALPLRERRQQLETFASRLMSGQERLRLSPVTEDIRIARKWLNDAGASLDGVIGKRRDLAYQSGERTGMVKIKRIRTVDCVVGGFRYASKRREVGSLLLGLYDRVGLLHHVGFTSGLKVTEKGSLTQTLKKLRGDPGFTGRTPGGPSRWATEKSGIWEPLRPELVVEVSYDHVSGDRFRHGTRLLRWRPEKSPQQCSLDQLGSGGNASLRMLRAQGNQPGKPRLENRARS